MNSCIREKISITGKRFIRVVYSKGFRKKLTNNASKRIMYYIM